MKTKTKLVKFLAIFLSVALLASSGSVYAQTGTSTDAVEPSDVELLTAIPGDSQARLSWDRATDNAGVTGYKIYQGTQSVQTSEDRYELPPVLVNNLNEYTVQNLINGQTYYFSVTALDAAGNESPNYSPEAAATPQSGLRLASLEDDGRPPQVTSITAEDIVTVKIVFSEPMRLPQEQPESAFQLEKLLDRSRLRVQNAVLDSRDVTGATVLLTTAPQEQGAEYVLTAGIELEDYYNNPIVSGTSDTGSFRGSAVQRAPASAASAQSLPSQTAPLSNGTPTAQTSSTPLDTAAPQLASGNADFDNRVVLAFSERVRLPSNPVSQFEIFKRGTTERLNVLNVSLSVDGRNAYVTTAPQQPVEYEVRVNGITDEAGNALASGSSVFVTGRGSALRDLIPPEDVLRLVARIKDAQNNIVELQWQGSPNSAGDLADQLLYQGSGRTNASFGSSTSLGTSTRSAEIRDLSPGNWYTFRVAARDTWNNESRGATASLFLPQTGPGAFAAGLTALFMGWYSRRKKK